MDVRPDLFSRKDISMNIQDTFLKTRAERAIALQEQGLFLIDQRSELPLPGPKSISNLKYSNERDENGRYYDYETPWGKFSFDIESQRSLLVLRKGMPPSELLPQSRLEVATATLHSGFVAIHNNGSSFDLDFQTRDRFSWETLRLINQTLAEEHLPVVVWQLDEATGETPPVIRITNDSAMLFASSAIWDTDEQQLVAAQVVTTSQELLKAIKATLANNGSKNYLTVKTPEDSAYLRGARRGYVSVNNSLASANADGTVTALLHPLSGDPQANSAGHFYLVVAPGENISQKFVERLDLAIPWPIQPEWAEYLLEAGQIADLVFLLPGSGKDFAAGFRILKNETKWQQVIADGLKEGRISIT
jgi:hypothetical protein